MILFPTIELMKGRCVSLRRGRLGEPKIWHVDPLEKAAEFAGAGANWMHITDFDGMYGDDRNFEPIAQMIRTPGLSVQISGGFRTQERIERYLEAGAARIVMGTIAARYPGWVREMAKYFPDQIVLSVDIWKGNLMVDGWTEASAIDPATLIEEFAETPLAAVKITDIDNDVDATEASLGVISGLAVHARAPVIASGLVHTIDDIARLAYVPNIEGALVGRALFERTVDLGEALRVAAEAKPSAAEFI
ncbi:MAG: 1-(5-phosphoribosyl)-5-[(5-phosphoribosylamino)methylideneamino] imidazole-4-carboxamide isomerase [Rhodobacteraceae bacterium]|nr:1-(5-phosphoribosyl)-5-[(5-phosphoribosylamino)methylideneamino] imidazole-4-carboxamide isomerase [Alphaproteobacteria bacterium]MBT8476695.1 1-(5-phosphoribosyl)-5-[(5-phosphoribosylamino)methylideneamino] imidazole-4-carboxamide isomerase [Alphaproteobacteria bacterium]NNF72939.1 1-(5-phosphoribosyl)-5-[(5-phosphoribosylamino)methylideneamino] imidazole-4-carboxamide isomerase [Paracoccaceae bacterium]NNK68277.1 1-(5-phosphoribosyl)-5-[(5-phosphoribosylamino)methylideneamino] imidazole-4-c